MAKKMSKLDAVRQTLSDLGKEAKPSDMQSYIKDKFGIDMTAKHISTYKGDILRGKKAPAKEPVNGAHAANHRPAPTHGSSSLAAQVSMLKQVAGAIGKEEAKKIIDLL